MVAFALSQKHSGHYKTSLHPPPPSKIKINKKSPLCQVAHTHQSQSHARTHARTHTQMHAHARIRTHAHARTHTHTHTHTGWGGGDANLNMHHMHSQQEDLYLCTAGERLSMKYYSLTNSLKQERTPKTTTK